MITLEASQTLEMTGAIGQVIVTADGMELNNSTKAEAYKILGQTGSSPVYTTPASTTTFIKAIFITSNSANEELITLYVGGSATTNKIYTARIPSGGSAVFNQKGWKIYNDRGVSLNNLTGLNSVIGTLDGNTDGTMQPVYGTVQLVGGNGIRLEQQNTSIQISHIASSMTYLDNMDTNNNSVLLPVDLNKIYCFPLSCPAAVAAQSLLFDMSNSISTITGSYYATGMTIEMRMAIFTGNTLLSPVSFGSFPVFTVNSVFAQTNLSRSMHGIRWVEMTSNSFNWQANSYVIGYQFVAYSQSGTQVSYFPSIANFTMNLIGQNWWNTMEKSGFVGSSSVANHTTQGNYPAIGVYSVTQTDFPIQINRTQLNKQINGANFIPHFVINKLVDFS